MKKSVIFLLGLLLLASFSSSSYAAKLPEATSLKWKTLETKPIFIKSNGYTYSWYDSKPEDGVSNFDSLIVYDKKGKKQYSYTSKEVLNRPFHADIFLGDDGSAYISHIHGTTGVTYLTKVDPKGKWSWEVQVTNKSESTLSFQVRYWSKENIYFFTDSGLKALSTVNGKQSWLYKSPEGTLDVEYSKTKDIFVFTTKDTIKVVKSGKTLWSKKLPKGYDSATIGDISNNGDISLNLSPNDWSKGSLLQVYSLTGVLKWKYNLPAGEHISRQSFNSKDQLLVANLEYSAAKFKWFDSKGKLFSEFTVPGSNGSEWFEHDQIYVNSSNFTYMRKDRWKGESYVGSSIQKVDKKGKVVAETKLSSSPSEHNSDYNEYLLHSNSKGKSYAEFHTLN